VNCKYIKTKIDEGFSGYDKSYLILNLIYQDNEIFNSPLFIEILFFAKHQLQNLFLIKFAGLKLFCNILREEK